MHELSLALDLVEQVIEVLRREQADRAVVVEVWIGDACGVDSEAFAFAFTEATAGTALDGAQLRVLTGPDHRFVLTSIEVPSVPD